MSFPLVAEEEEEEEEKRYFGLIIFHSYSIFRVNEKMDGET